MSIMLSELMDFPAGNIQFWEIKAKIKSNISYNCRLGSQTHLIRIIFLVFTFLTNFQLIVVNPTCQLATADCGLKLNLITSGWLVLISQRCNLIPKQHHKPSMFANCLTGDCQLIFVLGLKGLDNFVLNRIQSD
ncbi:MAG: hypothetical protein MZV64_21600 [Ignavibacteriales bacterium]|nr:hypothetical protein [Ignavibacteriales bacterium]